MGRTLRRVPLDFDWPIHERWYGYISPYQGAKCLPCGGTGLNPATRKIEEGWYSFDDQEWVVLDGGRRYNAKAWQHDLTQDEVDALVAANRLRDLTHVWDGPRGYVPREPPVHLTPAIVREWNLSSMGHDAVNRWICVETRAKRLGVYGQCAWCQGDGELWSDAFAQILAESWEKRDPPNGEGYQLWETTSEGSPISPVFATLEALCLWAEEHATTFGEAKTSAAMWQHMLEADDVHHQEGQHIFL
jgi:hypothetical protein